MIVDIVYVGNVIVEGGEEGGIFVRCIALCSVISFYNEEQEPVCCCSDGLARLSRAGQLCSYSS